MPRKKVVRKSVAKKAVRRKVTSLKTAKPAKSLKPAKAVKRALTGVLGGKLIQELSSMWDQVESQEKSEKAWQEMVSVNTFAEEDRWNDVQEHLLAEARSQDLNVRRWKYFGK